MKKGIEKKSYIIPTVLFLTIAFLLLIITIWIEKKFGVTSLESILFHLNLTYTKPPIYFVLSFIKNISLIFLLYFFIFSANYLSKRYYKKSIFNKKLYFISLIILLYSLVFINYKLHFIDFIAKETRDNKFIEESYYVNVNDIIFPEKKRNVIVIYLESVETTFYRKDLFSRSLMPYLEERQKKYQSSTLLCGPNLSWTGASVTGFMFGLPLNSVFGLHMNEYETSNKTFLPGAYSLLEPFSKNGYDIYYMSGTDMSFAGHDNIFYNHSTNPHLYDKNYWVSKGYNISNSYRSESWSIKDSDLYAGAKKEIEIFRRKNTNPFFLVLQTIDTHTPCVTPKEYPKFFGDERDTVINADILLNDFLNWLKEQDFYNNTTVLILGDHTYMGKTLAGINLDVSPRYISNLFMNTVLSDKDISDRKAIVLDLGASLLEAIGVKVPEHQFGLGISIFSDRKTLIEQYSLEKLSKLITGYSEFYKNLFISDTGPKEHFNKLGPIISDPNPSQ